jgi:hypothetical protein
VVHSLLSSAVRSDIQSVYGCSGTVRKGVLRRHVWAMSELSSELGCDVFLGQVSDVVPIVCRVASDMGVPSVCIGNFRCASLYCLHLGLSL